MRKNAAFAMQKQRGSFTNSPIRRERPLYLILRRAILLPRAAELSLPVCRLPSQAYAQWLTFVTQLSLFRCILALTVPFAVGFVPFPSELPPDQRSLVFTADSHTTSPDPIHLCRPAANVASIHCAPPLVNDFRQKLPPAAPGAGSIIDSRTGRKKTVPGRNRTRKEG